MSATAVVGVIAGVVAFVGLKLLLLWYFTRSH